MLGFCLLLGIGHQDTSRSLAAGPGDALQLEEAGNDVRAWLEHVSEFLKEKQWTDAVETLRRVMENRGDQMIATAVDPQWQTLGFTSFIPVREYCQMQLAAWHWQAPEALAVYRQQVDPLAKRLFDEAVADGSEAKLQRIVDEMLLSIVWRPGRVAIGRTGFGTRQLRLGAAQLGVHTSSVASEWGSGSRAPLFLRPFVVVGVTRTGLEQSMAGAGRDLPSDSARCPLAGLSGQ